MISFFKIMWYTFLTVFLIEIVVPGLFKYAVILGVIYFLYTGIKLLYGRRIEQK